MGNLGARAITAAATVLLFFVLWAAIAARPWAKSSPAATDPRMIALANRERSLKRHAAAVNRIVERRWAAYRVALGRRQASIALAEQRHLHDLELAYASAVAAARAADARSAAARAYAAQVVAWAESGGTRGGLQTVPAQGSAPGSVGSTRVAGSTAASAATTHTSTPAATQTPAPAVPAVAVAPPATAPVTTTSSSHH